MTEETTKNEEQPLEEEQKESLIQASKTKLIKIAEFLKSIAEAILGKARFLGVLSFLAGFWLWFLAFHTLLLSLWILPTILILLVLLLPSIILYRFIQSLYDLIDLPNQVRDSVKLSYEQAQKIKTNIPKPEHEKVVRKRWRWFGVVRSIILLFTQILAFREIREVSGTVLQFVNPIQKLVVIWSTIASIALIILALITGLGYIVFSLVF